MDSVTSTTLIFGFTKVSYSMLSVLLLSDRTLVYQTSKSNIPLQLNLTPVTWLFKFILGLKLAIF